MHKPLIIAALLAAGTIAGCGGSAIAEPADVAHTAYSPKSLAKAEKYVNSSMKKNAAENDSKVLKANTTCVGASKFAFTCITKMKLQNVPDTGICSLMTGTVHGKIDPVTHEGNFVSDDPSIDDIGKC
jgi:hypothetical protein